MRATPSAGREVRMYSNCLVDIRRRRRAMGLLLEVEVDAKAAVLRAGLCRRRNDMLCMDLIG